MSENNKTAIERLEDLENSMGQVGQALGSFQPMAQELAGLKEAIKLLNNKLDATIQALRASETLTDETLNKYMVANNVTELQNKVTQMVATGILAPSDTVTENSFVVINEADADGKIVNPRMQFLVSALQHEEVKTKLNGTKVGSNFQVGDKGASINVLEAYTIVVPKAPDAEAPTAAATDTAAPAAENPTAPDNAAGSETAATTAPATTEATASAAESA